MFINDEKANVEFHKANGYKTVVVGQPLAGKDVPKPTYISCINMLGPMPMIELLQKHKVASIIRVLSDFPMDANRNRFVTDSLASGADYLFFMDMDQTFPADALLNLFEVISDERPIVSGMYYLKKEPYSPVMGRYVDWEDDMIPHKDEFDKLGFIHPDGRQIVRWRSFTYFDKTTPFRADVIGLGCVLMKADIFKKLKAPYFSYNADPRPGLGHFTMDEVMSFCAQCAKNDIPIYIDPRVQCGHITSVESNNQLFEAYRDSQFSISARQDPKQFDEISKKFIDVREEQRSGNRFEKISA